MSEPIEIQELTPYEKARQVEMEALTETESELTEGVPSEPLESGDAAELESDVSSEGELEEARETDEAGTEPEPTQDTRFSSRFAALAREERRIRVQTNREREAIRAERAQLEAERAQFASIQSAIEQLKTDPLAGLKALGVDYEALTRRVITGGKDDHQDEIRQLRERQEQFEKERREQAEQAEKAQVEAVFAQARRDIAARVTEDKYPLASSYGASEVADVALRIIEREFSATEKVISYDAALAEVEKQLEAKFERLLKTKPQAARQKTPPRAITNRVATEPGTAPAELSYAERIEKAYRIARGEEV